MARVTLQIKNVASILLATGASIAWGVGAKRFFEAPPKPWFLFAGAGTLFLLSQLSLIFIESKEEEELSLLRQQRLEGVRMAIKENEILSIRIQQELQSGNVRNAKALDEFRRKRHG